jgi:hypothetical protein
VRDLLGVVLGLADKRLKASLQFAGRGAFKAVVDLAGVDEVVAAAPFCRKSGIASGVGPVHDGSD